MKNLFIMIFGILITLAFVQPAAEGPGVTAPQPVQPYLNIFPNKKPDPGNNSYSYTTEDAFPNLFFVDPVDLVELPNNKMMVIGKPGYIWLFDNNPMVVQKDLILDISGQVNVGEDGGLVGIVLHPQFVNNGYFYLWYRYTPQKGTNGQKGYMRLSRFTFDHVTQSVDAMTEFTLIQQYDRHDWHNGGDMFFGPDNFLYISVGDEGSSNDFYNTTQKLDGPLFSGILRIDVDMTGGSVSHPIRRQPINNPDAIPPNGWPPTFTAGYYIPNDNPWLDPNGTILEEFYAIGLRSPHRMTYDPVTGDIWVGDVGQGAREEIDVISSMDNLQWPYKEGNVNGPKSQPNPLIGTDTPPIFAYDRTFGSCVIGGYLYRGSLYPELYGNYIFADFTVQNIWFLTPNGSNPPTVTFLLNIPKEGEGTKQGPSSFGLGNDGTLYILDLFGTDLDGGKIHKLVRLTNSISDPPSKLSQLGVFTDLESLTPISGIIPYVTNAPLWSDRALKKRWIAIPNDGVHDTPDEKIIFSDEYSWKFPPGTVIIKHFELPIDERNPLITKKVETRFFVVDAQGTAYGLTYKWNDAQTDADLLTTSDTKDFTVIDQNGGSYLQTWDYPSREQCLNCHNSNAGFILGVNTRQINGDLTYPSGITSNQLETWEHLGMFDKKIGDSEQYPQLADIYDMEASKEFRFRSYIDANCSFCHRPNGAQGVFDARSLTALHEQLIINATLISNASPPGGKALIPGNKTNSEIWIRDNSLASNQMPPLAKNIIDDDYISLLSDWIDNLSNNVPSSLTDQWVFLKSRHSNMVLSPQGGSNKQGALIIQESNTVQDYQKWYIEALSGNKYRIGNKHSGMYLSVQTLSSGRGESLVQAAWVGGQHQEWYFQSADEGYHFIRSVYNGLNVEIFGGNTSEGGNVITWAPNHNKFHQQFELQTTSSTPIVCPTPGVTYLSDIPYEGTPVVGGNRVLSYDKSVSGNPIKIGNVTYTKGLGTHAYSSLYYILDNKYLRFKSDIGIDDNSNAPLNGPNGSVYFEVYLDGVLAYKSPDLVTRADGIETIDLNVIGVHEMRLVVTTGDDQSNASDHADWANARLESCLPVECNTANIAYLSDLSWVGTPINGDGPPELDQSNGSTAPGDGTTINIDGTTFSKGIGVQSYSEIVYDLAGQYNTFSTFLGVDFNSECLASSVRFKVYLDGLLAYESKLISKSSNPVPLELDVQGVKEMKLIVNDGGDMIDCNANWADAKLTYCVDDKLGIFTATSDIGSVGNLGMAYHFDGLYNLVGSGADIGGTSDEFRYIYRDQNGNADIIARVSFIEETNAFAKSGLMFRASNNADAAFVYLFQQPDNQVNFMWRTNQGGIASNAGGLVGGIDCVKYLKIRRINNDFSAYYSTYDEDGPWTKIGNTVNVVLPEISKIGLAVTATNNTTLCTSQFDHVEILEASDPKPIYVSVKVNLQGPWNNTSMNTNLAENNLIPYLNPYDMAPWNYLGSEEVEFLPDNIVDWVLVQIRDANNPSIVLVERSCLLREDGMIVDLNESDQVYFGKWTFNSGYVSVHHKNHLAIMSNTAIQFN